MEQAPLKENLMKRQAYLEGEPSLRVSQGLRRTSKKGSLKNGRTHLKGEPRVQENLIRWRPAKRRTILMGKPRP